MDVFESGKLLCYVINLDSKPQQWAVMQKELAAQNIQPLRFPAVNGRSMDGVPDPPRIRHCVYYWRQGRTITPGRQGCFVSHREVWRLFLASDAEYVMVCEDDINLAPDFRQIILESMTYAHTWDYLRVHQGRFWGVFPYATLPCGRQLCTALRDNVSGACYILNRKAADFFYRRTANMCAPSDSTRHYGWRAVRETSIYPSPVTLSEFAAESTITPRSVLGKMHPWHLAWWTMMMYRICFRVHRYSLQFLRAMRRMVFRPKPRPEDK